jgi:hypothetical protein
MNTQQIHIVPICPGLPLMPIASDEPKACEPQKRAPGMDDRQGRGNENATEITQEAT